MVAQWVSKDFRMQQMGKPGRLFERLQVVRKYTRQSSIGSGYLLERPIPDRHCRLGNTGQSSTAEKPLKKTGTRTSRLSASPRLQVFSKVQQQLKRLLRWRAGRF